MKELLTGPLGGPTGPLRALLVISALAACAPGVAERNPTGPATELGWKVVVEKREPVYLIAMDRTECTVTAQRFAEIRVGERALCAWSSRTPTTGLP